MKHSFENKGDMETLSDKQKPVFITQRPLKAVPKGPWEEAPRRRKAQKSGRSPRGFWGTSVKGKELDLLTADVRRAHCRL